MDGINSIWNSCLVWFKAPDNPSNLRLETHQCSLSTRLNDTLVPRGSWNSLISGKNIYWRRHVERVKRMWGSYQLLQILKINKAFENTSLKINRTNFISCCQWNEEVVFVVLKLLELNNAIHWKELLLKILCNWYWNYILYLLIMNDNL